MLQKLWVRAKNTIKDTNGSAAHFFSMFLVLFGVLIALITFEMSRRQLILRTVQDNVTEALTSCAAGNLYESFGTIREGTSGSYISDGKTYSEIIDTSHFISHLSMFYQSDPSGMSVTKYDSKGNIYLQVKDIRLYVENSKSLADKESTYLVRYNFVISSQFYRYELYSYPLEQKVKYTNKF